LVSEREREAHEMQSKKSRRPQRGESERARRSRERGGRKKETLPPPF